MRAQETHGGEWLRDTCPSLSALCDSVRSAYGAAVSLPESIILYLCLSWSLRSRSIDYGYFRLYLKVHLKACFQDD